MDVSPVGALLSFFPFFAFFTKIEERNMATGGKPPTKAPLKKGLLFTLVADPSGAPCRED
jgi:hypothetical protein